MKATKKKGGAVAMPSIGAVSPPPGAVLWSCWRVKQQPVVNEETGRKTTSQTRKRCEGEAQEDGSVPQLWKVEEFSTRALLEQWGPGKYMVEWWSKTNEKIAHHYLTIGTPRAQGEPTEEAPAPSPMMLGSMRMPTTPLEMMVYLQQREDAMREQRRIESREEDQRRRDEYERNAQRDRDFMTTLISTMKAPTPAQADGDLLRREMNLAIRESVAGLRGDVSQALERIREEREEPEDDDDDNPKDVGEGLERIGLSMLKELEDQAPGLIQKAIPAIVAFATKGGRPLSPGMKRAIEAARKKAQSDTDE